jgi:hypothetical protein
LENAGLLPQDSHFDEENRKLARKMALNWALRFLFAYADGCCDMEATEGQKDLAWLQCLVRKALA